MNKQAEILKYLPATLGHLVLKVDLGFHNLKTERMKSELNKLIKKGLVKRTEIGIYHLISKDSGERQELF